MEIVFLAILILLLVLALASGYPVAFALPGSAILTVVLASLCGHLFAGDIDAYFAQGGPIQWLNAGVTNFRGIYWEVERDTLIAIPLFVFMGIMLQRSMVAEDLLIAMAQLFGPVPGGLGVSVVFVGALLAATTGIVGATVIAMGLISLPVMLRNKYSPALATGTINASGTLGQIIPPSIVLIILADQLSNATDQASTIRKNAYKAATGEHSLPAEFAMTSASAGDMFLGAFLPGLVLVGLYMAYILVVALIKPKLAPPVPYDGAYDGAFIGRVLLALVPPLALIFIVLGSIMLGVATVNQAGAIGAIGAMMMAGYRLMAKKRGAYIPVILALVSVAAIVTVMSFFDVNIKSAGSHDNITGLVLAAVASATLITAIVWSGWRVYKADNALEMVMIETVKTTSLVFIILLGAAMLTSTFRAFGGEDLVRNFLIGLPGGFTTKFVVVMAVIFLLGFFLDFIEIAVVVVPIIAPILLADPAANITAVWLGVMIGVNMQTSFLTPPFGFALFYLRGVAPESVRTTQIYKGVAPFIALQLLGLAIAGFYPGLVNYLPNRVHLSSETAPPPMNPKLQRCMESYLFDEYDLHAVALGAAIDSTAELDIGYLPGNLQASLSGGLAAARATFEMVENTRAAAAALAAYVPNYRPLHRQVRALEVQVARIDRLLKDLGDELRYLKRGDNPDAEEIAGIEQQILDLGEEKAGFEATMPVNWTEARKHYVALAKAENTARQRYRRNADNAYEPVAELQTIISQAEALATLQGPLSDLANVIATAPAPDAMAAIKAAGKRLNPIAGVSAIKSALSKARRALKGDSPDRDAALEQHARAMALFADEVTWRLRATRELAVDLAAYDDAIRNSIGLRLQERLTTDQVVIVADCQSVHRDISLDF
jgi:tripartite ATP-independent transporter DctM subunit